MKREELVNKPVFCVRDGKLDCGIFTDKNLSGYGIGIRGNFFHDDELPFTTQDYLDRKLYLFTEDGVNDLCTDLGIPGDKKTKIDVIKGMMVSARKEYASAFPEGERNYGLYIEVELLDNFLHGGDIYNFINENEISENINPYALTYSIMTNNMVAFAKLSEKFEYTYQNLITATLYENEEMFDMILAKTDKSLLDHNILKKAIHVNNNSLFEKLFNYDILPDNDDDILRDIMELTISNNNKYIFEILFNTGKFNPNMWLNDYSCGVRRIIEFASYHNLKDIVKVCLKEDKIPKDSKKDALTYACKEDNGDIVEILLKDKRFLTKDILKKSVKAAISSEKFKLSRKLLDKLEEIC